jgi:hypothetical protein
MKNSILKYDLDEVTINLGFATEVKVRDYFSKDVKVFSIFDAHIDLFATYQIENDDKIERISYELYGTTDYWDILLLLNDRSPLFEMPYGYDLIHDFAQNRIDIYKNFIYSHAPLLNDRADVLFEELSEELLVKNENTRTIYVVKPSRMNDFISILKDENFI